VTQSQEALVATVLLDAAAVVVERGQMQRLHFQEPVATVATDSAS
jgi:hypothetical protein